MEYSGTEFDVIVVGAGVMGSSTAYQTAKRGQKTLLLEQFDFLHHRGSSHGESRTIRATYPEDYYTPLVLESYKLWQQAESEIGYNVYFKANQLDMALANDKVLLAVVESCRKNSLPFSVMNRDQLHQEFSGRVMIPEDWVGVVTEHGGVIKPTKAVSMFQTLALQNGAVLRDNMEVKGVERDGVRGGVWVSTAKGERFWGKKCVVTVGAWTTRLVKTVGGIELPIQPLETTVCYWRIKEGHEGAFAIGGDFPTFASYGNPSIYGTPSLEYPGLIKVAVHGGYPCDPDKRPWGPGNPLAPLKEWIEGRFSGVVDSCGPVATQLAKLREGEEWLSPLPSPEIKPRSGGSAPPVSSEDLVFWPFGFPYSIAAQANRGLSFFPKNKKKPRPKKGGRRKICILQLLETGNDLGNVLVCF